MRRNPSSGVAHQGRPGKEKHSIQNSGLHLRYGGAAHDTGRSAVMPPTGQACSITQTHWFRVADGKVIEHWANRDDMGMARQLGWVPPTPRYLIRMALARRRARKATA